MSLRAMKKAQTREALAASALALFGERGFDRVTIDDIAKSAGVSRRTFFRYFASKESSVFPEYAARLDAFVDLVEADTAEDPFDRVVSAMMILAVRYMEERSAHLLRWKVIASSVALVAYERELDMSWESEIATCLGADDDDPERAWLANTMAGAVMGMMRAVLRDWFRGDAQGDLVKLGAAGLNLLETGWSATRVPETV